MAPFLLGYTENGRIVCAGVCMRACVCVHRNRKRSISARKIITIMAKLKFTLIINQLKGLSAHSHQNFTHGLIICKQLFFLSIGTYLCSRNRFQLSHSMNINFHVRERLHHTPFALEPIQFCLLRLAVRTTTTPTRTSAPAVATTKLAKKLQ